MTERELKVRGKQEVGAQEHTRPGRTFVPDVDIYETPDAIWLWADMPGVEEESLEINLVEGVLSVFGQVSLSDYEGLAPSYTEYNVGNYTRRFTISDAIDGNAITARMKNGALEIKLPKAESAKPRRIPISAA